MFDKFGEFDSAEELNKAAEGLKEEGDKESLIELAKENGIDPEDAEDYWNSEMQHGVRSGHDDLETSGDQRQVEQHDRRHPVGL